MPKLLLNLKKTLTGERPGAVGLAAGIAFDLPPVGTEGEGVDDVAAQAPFVVTKRRVRPDPAHETTLASLPDERRSIAKLGKRKLERC